MKSVYLLIGFILSCATVMAQGDVEYNWEIGAGVGMVNYTGDFNDKVISGSNMSPTFSAVVKRTFNPYSAVRMSLGYGKLKGKADNIQTYYPDYNTGTHSETDREDYSFNNTLIDLNFTYEYNFWPYGTGQEYRGAQRFTPYIALGVGFSYVNLKNGSYDGSQNGATYGSSNALIGVPTNTAGSTFAMNIPLGVGVKYRVGDRTNLALQWLCHFTTSDRMDGVKDPYRIGTGTIFKNADCYQAFMFSVTYSFGPKCKTCMNQDW